MALPEEFTLINGDSASASFTTYFAMTNHSLASVHVVYSAMNTDTGAIQVRGTSDIVARTDPSLAKWASLSPEVTTMTSSFDNILFRIPDCDFSYVQVQYAANSNTTGSIYAYVVRKSYS